MLAQIVICSICYAKNANSLRLLCVQVKMVKTRKENVKNGRDVDIELNESESGMTVC